MGERSRSGPASPRAEGRAAHGITPRFGACHKHGSIAVVERFFRTFKLWWRLCLFAWAFSKERIAARMQTRLDVFRDWYNSRRGHQALGGWTPEQAWSESGPPTAIAIRAHEPQPVIRIRRHRYRGDAYLPDLELDIDWSNAA